MMSRKKSSTKVTQRPKKAGDGTPCDIFGAMLSDGDLIVSANVVTDYTVHHNGPFYHPQLLFGFIKKVGKTYVDVVLFYNDVEVGDDETIKLRIREPYKHLMQVHN